ncbi:hypothetical protein OLCHANIL_00145 [Vibrio phage V05]|nr:hypothetical protein OLCHANIL_00145 [Vibrio phage V05]
MGKFQKMSDFIAGIVGVFVVLFMAIVGLVWSIIEFIIGVLVLLGAVVVGIIATVLGAAIATIAWPFVEARKAYKEHRRKKND